MSGSPIGNAIERLIWDEIVFRFGRLSAGQTWGWLGFWGPEEKEPVLSVQVKADEDSDAISIFLSIDRVINENIEVWVKDGEWGEMDKWRGLLLAYSQRIEAAIIERER